MKQRRYWIISDTHFNHGKLVESGYRKEGFESTILTNCEKCFNHGDVIIHLGDLSFYQHGYWSLLYTGLPGIHWLVRGNHDKKTNSWYLSHGWRFVGESITLDIYGKRCVFTHEPLEEKGDFDINIHGHLHNLQHREGTRKSWNYLVQIEDTLVPINLRSICDNWNREH